MAIAVINHADLVQFAEKIGFPKYTKVQLVPEGYGYVTFDKFIRENVKWVSHIDVDPLIHVRITESAQLVGEIPEQWALRHQQFLEGETENNAFKVIGADVDGEWVELGTHVNRNAVRIAVGTAELKYKVDYELGDDHTVVNDNFLYVAIFDSAEDTSLSYSTNLLVDQIWTTRVTLIDDDKPLLQKRAYANYLLIEEAYPWIDVGVLTEEEYDIWKQHNLKPEEQANWANVDFSKIAENVQKTVNNKIASSFGVPPSLLAH